LQWKDEAFDKQQRVNTLLICKNREKGGS